MPETSQSAKTSAASQSVTAHAPCRVDLAGGTMDIWPLYLFHPGAVTVNFAVSVLTRCRITRLEGKQIRFVSLDTGRREEFASFEKFCATRRFNHPLAGYLVRFFAPHIDFAPGGIEVETNSESPAGAGISGSSALMIATTAAFAKFTGQRIEHEQIRVIAQNVEAQLIQVPTGCQDYYPALYGGVSAIHLDPDGIHHEAVRVAGEELDARFVLAYTGAPRKSGINNWEVFKSHINGDKKIFRNFERIGLIAKEMHQAISMGDWKNVGRLLREEWKLRKTNSPKITTPLIEKLIKAAVSNGARAAKVCGAGGGGCVVFLTEPETRERVAEAIRKSGGQVLPARVARDGLTVTGS